MKRRPAPVQASFGWDLDAGLLIPRVGRAEQPTFTELLGDTAVKTAPSHDPADPWGLAPPGVDVDDLSTVQHPTAYELRTPAPWEA